MSKPLLKDYGLTPELAKEILAANKKRYRWFWLAVNGCVIAVIILAAFFLPVSLNGRFAVIAGLIVIFYTLNYASVFKRLAIRIFKEHPQEKDLKRYFKAIKQYSLSQTTKAADSVIEQKIAELNLKPSDVMAEKKIGFHGPFVPGVIHGARYIPTETTNGWYVWQGERNDSPEFFDARHGAHVISEYPYLAKYLMLPPGYRFLIDTRNGHEEIWFDEKCLVV